MKPGELIDLCIECYCTYSPSKVTLDSHLEVFLAKIDATDEGDAVFIKQVVYGCIRFKKLNKVTLTALYFKHGTQVTCLRRASRPLPPTPSTHPERSHVAGQRRRQASRSLRRGRLRSVMRTAPAGMPRLDLARNALEACACRSLAGSSCRACWWPGCAGWGVCALLDKFRLIVRLTRGNLVPTLNPKP